MTDRNELANRIATLMDTIGLSGNPGSLRVLCELYQINPDSLGLVERWYHFHGKNVPKWQQILNRAQNGWLWYLYKNEFGYSSQDLYEFFKRSDIIHG